MKHDIPKNTKNILTYMIDNNIKTDYQCKDGYCGVCKCELVSGEFKYTKEHYVYLNNNEILPCICSTEHGIILNTV